MKIKLTSDEYNGRVVYRADFEELPGSPYVGVGETKEMAVACLFIRNREKIEKLLEDNKLYINGVIWKDVYVD